MLLGQLRSFAEANVVKEESIKRRPLRIEGLSELLSQFKTPEMLQHLHSEVMENDLSELQKTLNEEYKKVSDNAKITYGGLLGELMYEAFKNSSNTDKVKLLCAILQFGVKQSMEIPLYIAVNYSLNLYDMLKEDKDKLNELFSSNKKEKKSIFQKTGITVKGENILKASHLSSVEEANQLSLSLGYAYFSYKSNFYVSKVEGAEKTEILYV